MGVMQRAAERAKRETLALLKGLAQIIGTIAATIAVLVGGVYLIRWYMGEPAPRAPRAPIPRGRVVGEAVSGGWANIELVSKKNPLAVAKRCVHERKSSPAVACFVFSTQAARDASLPAAPGNYKGPSCWSARWQRNKLGDESGRQNAARDTSCPD